MDTLEVSPSFCADKDENVDKDEDVEERERLHWGLEGHQHYKRWRSLLIWTCLDIWIIDY